MKGCNVIWLLTAAASLLFFCTVGYGWSQEWETIYYDKLAETGGDGEEKEASATYEYYCESKTKVKIIDPQSNTWAGAYAYLYGRHYVEDYDNEDLTAYVDCTCQSVAAAAGPLGTSDYFMKSGTEGDVGPYSADTYLEFTEDDDGDVDTDGFYDQEIDVSYEGASVYIWEFTFAQAEAYSSSGTLRLEVTALSDTECDIQEDP